MDCIWPSKKMCCYLFVLKLLVDLNSKVSYSPHSLFLWDKVGGKTLVQAVLMLWEIFLCWLKRSSLLWLTELSSPQMTPTNTLVIESIFLLFSIDECGWGSCWVRRMMHRTCNLSIWYTLLLSEAYSVTRWAIFESSWWQICLQK